MPARLVGQFGLPQGRAFLDGDPLRLVGRGGNAWQAGLWIEDTGIAPDQGGEARPALLQVRSRLRQRGADDEPLRLRLGHVGARQIALAFA